MQTDARLALRGHCYRNANQRQVLANSSTIQSGGNVILSTSIGKKSKLPDIFGTSARVIKADTSGHHRSEAIPGRPKNNNNHLHSLNRRRYADSLSIAVACKKGRCLTRLYSQYTNTNSSLRRVVNGYHYIGYRARYTMLVYTYI